jgi:cytochrome c-type biogenesis protein CcmH
MLVWFILALMTGAAVAIVLWPLSRRVAEAPAGATDADFYRSQLAEIERDAERGLLPAEEAETAKAEAARRLIRATRLEDSQEPAVASDRRRRAAALVALLGIPVVSLGLYLRLGNPDMPGEPLASRQERQEDPSLAQAVAQIEAHLAKEPNDGRGWEVIAPVYLRGGRFDDAVRAFENAIRILGETPKRLGDYAEALVVANNGVVSADARAALDKALASDPKDTRARFYRALGYEQDGDKGKALEGYEALAKDAPAGSPIVQLLSTKIAQLGGKPPAATGPLAMPQDQMAMVRGMVDNLSARLAQDGRDVDGWIRLIRSYVVLGEPDKAREALARGRAALADDQAGRERLEASARELKVGS